ncbi:TelA-like protein SA1238 [Serratia quinivorans]|uniref:toxic anion resistance protein n=1 Tax=Serratia quinivorans TaxID=137545 RepID=UPI00217C6D6F|nr:toxic anion resistance protein [Serratia quinivorans]CAI0888987.1 TelA-like protein SA1238 [Serratia quinivorans]CAI1178862.1 TelA-like protein SA1238 [Serratia quinivorans]CAI1201121.1 TelA-like protein SA1238 [Serratia quinivorans]CAI2005841.1 TelA-like protein SA1238 [Serratia quinivorans]CAI2155943.1 TelA-like protein SA1238 [Serratia quinivorans]
MTENTSSSLLPQQADSSFTSPLNQALAKVADERLSQQDQEEVSRLVSQIDITDPVLSIAYGAKTMNSISRFSESLMQEVRAKDAGMIGDQLTDLLSKVKAVDLSAFGEKKSLMASIPLLGSLFNKVERTMMEYQTLAQQVDNIGKKLEQTMVDLLRNIAVLEQLFIRNRDFFQQINLHVIAGKQKLALVQTEELAQAQQKASQSSDAMDAQNVRDLLEGIQRFERRLHDLMMSRTIAVQTAPQIRLMQSNSQSLAEKIQSSILTTIPIWKSQIVLALSLNSQRQAAKLQKDVADTTNDMLRRNAELLQTGTLETARQVERSIVDIETLRDVQARLLSTIEDTVTIASDARSRRAEVEKELGTMEQELRNRLASIAAGQRQTSAG